MPIRSRSWLGEPEVTRWFRIIGYEQLQGNGSRLFELPPA
jgi:hypothetical protein